MTKAPTVAETIAHRVRKYRRERDWSVRQLADECAKRGATTLTQASLTNIERGLTSTSGRGSRAVSVEEMLTLAAVLQVPPIMLMVPFGEHNAVEVSPGVTMEPWTVSKWLFGTDAYRAGFGLAEPEGGRGTYERTAGVITYVQQVYFARQRAHDLHGLINATDEQLLALYRRRHDSLPLIGTDEDIPEDEWPAEARAVMPELYEARLREYADCMWQAHNAGVRVPTVPRHLYDAIVALPPLPEKAEDQSAAVLAPEAARRPILPPALDVEDYDGDR